VPLTPTAKRDLERRAAIAAEAEIDRFLDATAWRRSSKGNLYREWYGRLVTLFATRYGGHRWVVSGAGEPSAFSEQTYRTENDAMAGACSGLVDW
jgi:hypothetical protein